MFEISMRASFEAAHYLEVEGSADHYKTMHGHSFVVTATMSTRALGPHGWVYDLGELERILKETLAGLDHKVLNDVEDLASPTLERMLEWIHARLAKAGVAASRVEIERPTLGQRAAFTPEG